MKKSFFKEIFTGYLVVIVLFSIIIGLISITSIKHFYITSNSSQLEKISKSLSVSVIVILQRNNITELNEFVKKMDIDLDVRITVMDKDGAVLADSQEDYKAMDNHRTRPEVNSALSGYIESSIRYSKTLKEDMMYVAVPLVSGGSIIGAIRLSYFMKDMTRFLAGLRTKIIIAMGLIIVLALIISWLYARRISGPVRSLNEASKKMAEGNFDIELLVNGNNELAQLGQSFGHMTKTIRNLIQELSEQKEEMRGIISSVDAGILGLDKNDKVFLCNDAFKKLTDNSDVMNVYILQLIREPEFAELLKKIKVSKHNETREVNIGNKIYLCNMTYVELNSEIIAIFNDITALKEIENFKKDFVQNVSHELRTPLSLIKGFIETMEDGKKYNEEYMNIIKSGTDRMISIVNDLLTLSKLENQKSLIEKHEFDVEKMITNILTIFKERIKSKGLNTEIEVDKNVKTIIADEFKLEQALINLIDNAVKYTESGAIKINVLKNENKVIFKVQDNGIGIPEEHLNRIFERFYVVDKSRSRQLGGTGLGLSIVKHIVLLHNGEITVESKPNFGTTFTIKIPV
ncbi:MAG: ATP-binding protein [Elusimicrobiota bacterium]